MTTKINLCVTKFNLFNQDATWMYFKRMTWFYSALKDVQSLCHHSLQKLCTQSSSHNIEKKVQAVQAGCHWDRGLKVNDVLKHKAAGWDQYFCLLILHPHLLCFQALKICCSQCWPVIITVFIMEFISFTSVGIWLSRCFILFSQECITSGSIKCNHLCFTSAEFIYVWKQYLMSYSESYNKYLSWLMQISHINLIQIRHRKGLNYKVKSPLGDIYLIFVCLYQ